MESIMKIPLKQRTLLGFILRDKELYAEAELHYKHALLAAEMLSGENVYSVIGRLMDFA